MNNETLIGLLGAWSLPTRIKTTKILKGKYVKRSYNHNQAEDIKFVCIYKKKNSWWPFSESSLLVSVKIYHKFDLLMDLNLDNPPVSEGCIDWFEDLSMIKFTDHDWTTITELKEQIV